ncbi:MAG TPA: monomethylamine:corrinoid methyltransferase [Dehalococcoidales bacterium]|nr:monomethylamine:corrinoid methyltransferase [Dehalococcoidales bacterium]
MASIERALQILDKAQTGPICTTKGWGLKLSKTITEKLKKYGLEKTFDTENPINTDDGLADRFYKVGYELALEMGMFCQDTERIIKVTEEELADAIRNAPSELVLGKGKDTVVLKSRKPEDKLQPLSFSPMGHLISEDVWVRLVQGIAQQPEIDGLRSPVSPTVFGRPVLADTPYETIAGRYEAQLTKEALWRAGRTGLCTLSVASSPTAYGHLGGYGIPGGFDPESTLVIILCPAEMTTAYTALHKVVHVISCGGKTYVGDASMIGGYSGPPEGAALTQIAANLLQFAVHQADCHGGEELDVRYSGGCGREGQWAESIACQAIRLNTHLLNINVMNQLAGPSTEMLLYESAVAMLNVSTSGGAGYLGPRTSGTKYANHITPLECKFCAEVLKCSAGMTRKQANEIAKLLIPKYENMLWDPPIGKSFRDCYDMNTLRPTQEWLGIYLKIKRELIDLGVPLNYS